MRRGVTPGVKTRGVGEAGEREREEEGGEIIPRAVRGRQGLGYTRRCLQYGGLGACEGDG